MQYSNLSEYQKKELIHQEYTIEKKSLQDIAIEHNTYPNKIRRDDIRFNTPLRDKSAAQKNALVTGKHKHPTKGTMRPQETKDRIGLSVMNSWENLDPKILKQRKKKAKENWDNLSEDAKSNMLHEANLAVRKASKIGSKLEIFLFNSLLQDGYKVDFHKEQSILNTKLQLDLFVPILNTAVEIDGPSHFVPVWGKDTLKRNQGYDNKKTGLVLGKGLVLIRIKQSKDFSKARAKIVYDQLKVELEKIKSKFPAVDQRNIEIGD